MSFGDNEKDRYGTLKPFEFRVFLVISEDHAWVSSCWFWAPLSLLRDPDLIDFLVSSTLGAAGNSVHDSCQLEETPSCSFYLKVLVVTISGSSQFPIDVDPTVRSPHLVKSAGSVFSPVQGSKLRIAVGVQRAFSWPGHSHSSWLLLIN